MYRTATLLAGFAALFGVGLVAAQQGPDGNPPPPPPDCPGPPVIAALDTNADGTISADEIANASQSLLTLDANGDGQLTADELRPDGPPCGPPPGCGRRGPGPNIMSHDTNGDGVVTLEELTADVTAKFNQLDANGDGVIDSTDLDQLDGPPYFRRIMRHDTNGDGQVTLEEFLAAATDRFNQIDTNSDGQIDQDEAAAARPPHHGRGYGKQGVSGRGQRGGYRGGR